MDQPVAFRGPWPARAAGAGRTGRPHPFACRACPARGRALCRAMPLDSLAQLEAVREPLRVLAADETFIHQGETPRQVGIVVEGWVFLYELLADGRRQILHFALPGDVLGLDPQAAPLPFGAQALTKARICVLDRHRLLNLARRHPDLALGLAGITSRDETLAMSRLTHLGRRTALERVAYFLLETFCRARLRLPKGGDPGEALDLPLTQTHIGDALGLTPVHTNRMLRILREAGTLTLEQHRLRIQDPNRLAEVAGFDRDVFLPWLTGPG